MIAITHPIKQMINSQHGFLSSMLERFPSLLDEWIKKQEEEVEQFAKEFETENDDTIWHSDDAILTCLQNGKAWIEGTYQETNDVK